MLVIVVEDRQADAALRRVLAAARGRSEPCVVLTADAILAMRLRREGVDARLPLDCFVAGGADEARGRIEAADRRALADAARALGDYARFGGTDFAPYLEYTLIPSFVRAFRNVTAVQAIAATTPGRLTLVGGGSLVQAARLVAAERGLSVEQVAGDVVTRARHALARLRGGRATRWVNTEFRALVLEPGFLALLFAKGFWRRLTSRPPSPSPHAIVVAGDRFTADVVERLRGKPQSIVLAGATQPGRALFDDVPGLVTIEAFSTWRDLVTGAGAALDAAARAAALAGDREHGRAFVAGTVCYWPLVRRTAACHVLAWVPHLRHLAALTARAAAAPGARVLTANDVTAYNRVLIDTARRSGAASIGIQHGMTAEPNGHSAVHVDTLATWGEQTEEWYRFHATAQALELRARFVVTGNPRYDQLALRVAAAASSPAPAASTTPSSAFTICVCTGFLTDFSTAASEYENLLMIDTVLTWARQQPGVRVVHKIHPGEELTYYADAARALGWTPVELTTIAEPVLHDLLQRSDVLVSQYSSTVLESLALGTPALIFDAATRRQMVRTPGHPLDAVPGVSVAYSLADVGEQLRAIRDRRPIDPAAIRNSRELRAFLSELDGQAAARVAALVRA